LVSCFTFILIKPVLTCSLAGPEIIKNSNWHLIELNYIQSMASKAVVGRVVVAQWTLKLKSVFVIVKVPANFNLLHNT
jgi:hypothetical protein